MEKSGRRDSSVGVRKRTCAIPVTTVSIRYPDKDERIIDAQMMVKVVARKSMTAQMVLVASTALSGRAERERQACWAEY